MKMKFHLFPGVVITALAAACSTPSDSCASKQCASAPAAAKVEKAKRPASPSCRQSKLPYKLGVARYTMCKRSLDEALDILQNIDCHYLGLMGGTIAYDASDEEIAAYKAKCAAAGVEVVSAGPLYYSTEAELKACCAFAKRYGMKYISVVPFEWNPKIAGITDSKERAKIIPPREWRIESDRMMDILDQHVKKYDLRAAVHNHGPDNAYLYPTAEAAIKRIGNRDKRIGVCLDVGHERRAGLDPVAFIRNNPDRIVEVHLKNIKIDPVKNIAKEGPRGELDIPGILRALGDIGFGGYCLIEFEKDFTLNEAPLAESLGYYRGCMDSVAESVDLAPFPDFSAPRALTKGPHDHFLANYFAINAWSPDNRYVLTIETDIKDKLPDGAPCTLGMVDTEDGNRFIPVTTTRCWNFQEAAMAHWVPCEKDTIVFNDLRDGKFCAVVMNWKTKEERVIPGFPVSALSEDGKWALSINYARLYVTRPDYGYAGDGQDARVNAVFPEDDGLWRVDLKTGEAKLIVSCAAVKRMVPQVATNGMSYICHTVISKDMQRVYFLSRSVDQSMAGVKRFKGVNWHTTAFTSKADGTEIRRCFPDGWGSSHFNWKPNLSERDARTMIVTCKWLNKIYTHVEFTVGEEDYPRQIGGKEMNFDGHCIYSPDGEFVAGDGYWDKNFYRHWKMVRLADNKVKHIGDFYVHEPYRDIYCRCDLHPRWRPDGKQIGFNSVHEGSRQVYVMDAK